MQDRPKSHGTTQVACVSQRALLLCSLLTQGRPKESCACSVRTYDPCPAFNALDANARLAIPSDAIDKVLRKHFSVSLLCPAILGLTHLWRLQSMISLLGLRFEKHVLYSCTRLDPGAPGGARDSAAQSRCSPPRRRFPRQRPLHRPGVRPVLGERTVRALSGKVK